jgi:RES domain-containing protein
MIKEAQQSFTRKLDPLTIASYGVDCEDVVDLTNDDELRRVGIAASDLACGWKVLASNRKPVPSWLAAERLVREGYAAAVVPSYAAGATTADRNLIFWRWGAGPPHSIVVHDPDGRLPKDQSSSR